MIGLKHRIPQSIFKDAAILKVVRRHLDNYGMPKDDVLHMDKNAIEYGFLFKHDVLDHLVIIQVFMQLSVKYPGASSLLPYLQNSADLEMPLIASQLEHVRTSDGFLGSQSRAYLKRKINTILKDPDSIKNRRIRSLLLQLLDTEQFQEDLLNTWIELTGRVIRALMDAFLFALLDMRQYQTTNAHYLVINHNYANDPDHSGTDIIEDIRSNQNLHHILIYILESVLQPAKITKYLSGDSDLEFVASYKFLIRLLYLANEEFFTGIFGPEVLQYQPPEA